MREYREGEGRLQVLKITKLKVSLGILVYTHLDNHCPFKFLFCYDRFNVHVQNPDVQESFKIHVMTFEL